MVAVLDLNDSQLTLLNAQGEISYQASAAAAFHHGDLIFGREALAVARTLPQHFNQRYFSSVSAQPLPASLGEAYNHADLIYQHLATVPLHRDEPLLLCVPTHWSNDQLGLLLGVFQELGVQISGFVDSALSQLIKCANVIEVGVVDLELHRLVLTQCNYQAGVLTAVDHRVWEGRGYLHLLEGWMSLIADEYVQHTRFDPLHSGDTEQQLLNQLMNWVSRYAATGKLENLRASIEHQGEPREIDIQSDLLAAKVTQRMAAIELPNSLALSKRVQNVPGLENCLTGRSTFPDQTSAAPIMRLAGIEQLFESFQLLAKSLPVDSVSRVLSSTYLHQQENATPAPVQSNVVSRITHLLHANHAHPLSQFGLRASPEGIELDPGLAQQDLDVDAQALGNIQLGDTVIIAGQPYIAVTVRE